MRLVLDNSIIFKLFIEEEKSEIARDIFAQEHEFYFLDFTLIEAANSFASAVRRNRISKAKANEIFEALRIMAQNIIESNSLLKPAFVLGLEINHPVYDCLYAIAARENGAVLVTADGKFAQKLNQEEFKTMII